MSLRLVIRVDMLEKHREAMDVLTALGHGKKSAAIREGFEMWWKIHEEECKEEAKALARKILELDK